MGMAYLENLFFFYFTSAKSVTKRSVNEDPFRLEDIYIPSDPKEVDGGISVEYAVVITSADGRLVVVSSKALADLIERKAAEIGQKLAGIIVDAKAKPKPIKDKPKGRTEGKEKRTGLVTGVVVPVGLVVIIAVIVWHLRLANF